MDLTQRKLTRSEWDNIEKKIDSDEKRIVQMIVDGFHETNIRFNENPSLFEHLNLNDDSDAMHKYLYKTYFKDTIEKFKNKYSIISDFDTDDINKKHTIKKVDSFKIENSSIKHINENVNNVYEFVVLEIISSLLKRYEKKSKRWKKHYYTLTSITNINNIKNINTQIKLFENYIIEKFKNYISLQDIVLNSEEFIEKNPYIIGLSDISLYSHQKELFNTFNKNTSTNNSNLVLYIAPTATGKTMSPLALSEKYKIIFLCAARHVGIALSKYALSCNKKIAFAFGANDSSEIRLHYGAASEFIKKDDGSGKAIKYKDGRKKIDNSVGDKVEIMVCDLKSFQVAHDYMLSWNNYRTDNIILYWDEPTITLDYDEHPYHEIISDIWKKNEIQHIVLSSATLPDHEDITSVIENFKLKQNNLERNPIVKTIKSYECKKTISIIDKFGFVSLPHLLWNDYRKIMRSVEHIKKNKTLIRYLDLNEVSKFIIWINSKSSSSMKNIVPDELLIDNYFNSISDISLEKIKINYLDLLQNINICDYSWSNIFQYFQNEKTTKIKPRNSDNVFTDYNLKKTKSQEGTIEQATSFRRTTSLSSKPSLANSLVNITTSDAFTLTDGPTIYIARDVDKIGKFCLQSAQIPASTMKEINESIRFNNILSDKIKEHEDKIEDILMKFESKSSSTKDDKKKVSDKKLDRIFENNDDIKKLNKELDNYRASIKDVGIPGLYVPNKTEHLKRWTNETNFDNKPYTSKITDQDVLNVMSISSVSEIWKFLLILGIGVFSKNVNVDYLEIVKEFATEQKLYLIIADADYIYGTNYQFCHGYISKDMIENLTQEKCIQSMGRIGRNKNQMDYTIRFREDEIINKIFMDDSYKPEAINLCKLFND